MATIDIDIPTTNTDYDFKDEDVSVFKTPKGLNEDIVREISAIKNEPEWISFKIFKMFLGKTNANMGC